MGWKVNLWARLLDGEHAFKLLNSLFRLVRSNSTKMTGGGTYPNLFDAHPPFQIDGNFGVTAGIAEMLIQSHGGEIHLLPALPQAWHTGKVTGLKARGGFTVDMEWANGQLTKATIHSVLGGNCRIRTNEKRTVNMTFEIAKGESPNRLFDVIDAGKPLIKDPSKLMEMTVNQGFVIDFKTKKGGIYTIL